MSRVLIGVGIALGLGLLAGVLYLAEWKEVEVPGPPSEEARRNPYLAAERFLERFDVETHRNQGLSLLDDLPPTSGTIVIGASLRGVAPRRRDALLDWVERGGRVVLVATELESASGEANDPLLARLGISLREAEDEDDEAQQEELSDEEKVQEILQDLALMADRCGSGERLTSIWLEGEQHAMKAMFSANRQLSFDPQLGYAAATSPAGYQLVSAALGGGRVHVVTSAALWRNPQIGCHDHAHVLRWLGEGRAGVWWLVDLEVPGILEILTDRFTIATGLTAILLVLWIWRGERSTQLAPKDPGQRRSVLEHVQGMARFRWQQGQGAALVDELRLSVLRGLTFEDEGARADWFSAAARTAGVSEEQVRWALESEVTKDVQAVKRMVRILNDINTHK